MPRFEARAGACTGSSPKETDKGMRSGTGNMCGYTGNMCLVCTLQAGCLPSQKYSPGELWHWQHVQKYWQHVRRLYNASGPTTPTEITAPDLTLACAYIEKLQGLKSIRSPRRSAIDTHVCNIAGGPHTKAKHLPSAASSAKICGRSGLPGNTSPRLQIAVSLRCTVE